MELGLRTFAELEWAESEFDLALAGLAVHGALVRVHLEVRGADRVLDRVVAVQGARAPRKAVLHHDARRTELARHYRARITA